MQKLAKILSEDLDLHQVYLAYELHPQKQAHPFKGLLRDAFNKQAASLKDTWLHRQVTASILWETVKSVRYHVSQTVAKDASRLQKIFCRKKIMVSSYVIEIEPYHENELLECLPEAVKFVLQENRVEWSHDSTFLRVKFSDGKYAKSCFEFLK